MGYYTEFTIFVAADPNGDLLNDSSTSKVEEFFRSCDSNNEEIWSMFTNAQSDNETIFMAEETMKWYDHDDDMKKLSLAFTDVLFELRGIGEEAGDIWNTYYLNGKSAHHMASISYEPFNPGNLT